MIGKNKYGSYFIDEKFKHRPACKTILNGGVHEQDTINFILTHAGDYPIISAGSFFGDFLPAFKNLKKVYTFEPVKLNYEACLKTISINNLKNVHIENCALSCDDDNKKINTFNKNTNLHNGGASFISINGDEVIKCKKIDDVIKEKISIIQLDIEGHELEALRGATGTIKKYKPIIILEFINYSLIEIYKNFLEDLVDGYYDKFKILLDSGGDNVIFYH